MTVPTEEVTLCVDRGISPKEEVILYEQIRSHVYCETS